MSKCININHPEFNRLVKQSGIGPLELSAKMGVWMEENDTNEWPTLKDLGIGKKELFSSVEDIEEYLFKTSNGVDYFKKYNNQIWVKYRNKSTKDLSDANKWVDKMNAIYPGLFELEKVPITENKKGSTRKTGWVLNIHKEALNNKANKINTSSPNVQYSLKVVSELLKISDIRNTIKLNTKSRPYLEKNLRKQLSGRGVSNDQITFIFDYMKENDISEISAEDLALDIASTYAFTVKIDIGKYLKGTYNEEDNQYEPDYDENGHMITSISQSKEPSSYYSNLTVPGGTNYTENEIATPAITPNIKGHAQFSTDNGIGWFRSDEKTQQFTGKIDYEKELKGRDGYDFEAKVAKYFNLEEPFPTKEQKIQYLKNTLTLDNRIEGSKTRRILEVQSDLFQKSRDKKDLILKTTVGDVEDQLSSFENKFLQLLNKDNNWITFFVKSIVQDSAKKGYETVLFPKGETAAKVEGHNTIADEIRRKDNEINALKPHYTIYIEGRTQNVKTIEEANQIVDTYNNTLDEDNPFSAKAYFKETEVTPDYKEKIAKLEQEKTNLKSQGIEKLKPIEAFYEKTIGNILEKQYGKDNVKTIKDEYGNEWREIKIDKTRDLGTIVFKKVDLTEEQSTLQEDEISTINKISQIIKETEDPVEVLKYISKNIDTSDIFNNKLFNLFINKLKNKGYKIKIGSVKNEDPTQTIFMEVGGGVITINQDTLDDYESLEDFLLTLLHELVHIPTVYLFHSDDSALDSEEIELRDTLLNTFLELRSLRSEYNNNKYGRRLSKQYGWTNVKEFVSELMVNPNFLHQVKVLSEYASKKGKKSSVESNVNINNKLSTWQKIVNAFYKFFLGKDKYMIREKNESKELYNNVFNIILDHLYNPNRKLDKANKIKTLEKIISRKVKVNTKDINSIKQRLDEVKNEVKKLKDEGVEFNSFSTLMKENRYGRRPNDVIEDDSSIKIGNTVHEGLENAVNNAVKDIIGDTGYTLSPEAKKDIEELINGLRSKGETLISEVMVADPQIKFLGKLDLLQIDANGNLHIYDFKSKVKGFKFYEKPFIPKDANTTDQNDPNYIVPYSDRQSVHLQMSIYRTLLLRMIGVKAVDMTTIMLKPTVKDGIITSIKLDTTISNDGMDIFTTNSKDIYKILPTRRSKNKSNKQKTKSDDTGVTDEGNFSAEVEFLEYLRGRYELSEIDNIVEKLIKALKNKQKILENKMHTNVIKKELANKFIENLIKEEDVNKQLIQIIRQAYKSTTDIYNDFLSVKNDENKNFTPEMLASWKEYVSSYDELDALEAHLNLTGTSIDEKGKTTFKEMLSEAIKQKNLIKQAYKTIGYDLMADYLAPFYNRLYAEHRLNAKKAYRKLSVEEKAKISEYDYVENKIYENSDNLEKATKNLIKGELRQSNGDINILKRWMDNTLDSRDPVVAALVKSFALIDIDSKQQSLVKRHQILMQTENLEAYKSQGVFTSLEDYYSFMLEVDEEGKKTGHYITRYRSSIMEDYKEIISIINKYDDKNEKLKELIKKVWKEGFLSLKKKEDYDLIKKELDKQRELIDNNDSSAKFTIKALNQFNNEGNAPLDRASFNMALDKYLLQLLDTKDENEEPILTEREYKELKINSDKKADWYNTNELVEKKIISEQAGNYILRWLYKYTWDYRIPNSKYENPQWEKLSKILEDENDQRGVFYKMIVEIGREADLKLPSKFRLGSRLPSVVKQLSERIQDKQSPSEIFKRTFGQAFTLKEEDTFREKEENIIMGDDGKRKYFLPIHYTSKLDIEEQSFDIPSLYMKYWDMANDHNMKAEILPSIEMAKFFVDSRDNIMNKNFGHTILKKISGDKTEPEIIGKNTNLSAQLNDWFASVVYGERSVKGSNINVFGLFEINVDKTLDVINKYTALNLLGFNFIQGTANVILGETLQGIETIASEYISSKAYRDGSIYYGKHLPEILGDIGRRAPISTASLIIEHFDVLNEYNDTSFRKNNRFRQLSTTNTLYFTSHAGEHFMQSRMLFAFLANRKAYNSKGEEIGKILDYYTAKDGKLIFDANKEVDLVKSKWENKDRKEMQYILKGLLSRIHGEYSDLGRVALQRYALGRMAYMFRKFIVPGWKRRWEKYDYSERLNDFTEGNYRTTGKFIQTLIKDTQGLKFALMSEKWDELSDMEKANIARTLSEITFLLAAIILGNLFIKIGDDDEYDEKGWAFLAYQMFRYKAELLFFISPPQAIAILRSPMASISVFENTLDLMSQMWHPFEVYEKGPNKDTLKLWKETRDMIPFYRQLYRMDTLENTINFFR